MSLFPSVRSLLRLESLVAMFAAGFFVAYVWPASWWYEVERISVLEPVYVDEDIHLSVDRTIRREFFGEYDVVVRSLPLKVVLCAGSGSVRYSPEAHLPENVTLEWWVNAECPPLDAGTYSLETTWWIEWSPFSSLDKIVVYDTVFHVLPPPELPEGPLLKLQVDQLQNEIEQLKGTLRQELSR